MNRDDIIRLAKEVDAEISAFIDYHYDQEMVVFSKGQLERFAALVAAAEREEWIAVAEKALEALELRTQTVRVADEGRDYKLTMSAITALRAAIRARGT